MKVALKSGPDYSPSTGAPGTVTLTLPMECSGQRLDQALSRLLPQFSRSRITHWIREGLVEFQGAAAQPKAKVRGGETVRVTPLPDPADTAHAPEAIALDIVHEDAHLLVVNKPPGLVVHPGSGNWAGTMLNALLAHAPALAHIPRAGIVHRLDKDTSGLLVVAKTLESQASLARQLHARSVRREYLALARGRIDENGRVEAPIGRHRTQRTRMAVVDGGKPAVTHYTVIAHYTGATLLECRLETGRTHQIRVHLQSLGHPLVGDPLYGRRMDDPLLASFTRQALHARRLELVHPASGETVSWDAEPPADLRGLLERLAAAA